MATLFSIQNLDFDSIGSSDSTTETKSCKISILNGKGKKNVLKLRFLISLRLKQRVFKKQYPPIVVCEEML